MPRGKELYTHRTGRTGRMGKKGKALTFVTKHELSDLRELIHRNNISPHWIGEDPFKKSGVTKKLGPRKRKRPYRGKDKKIAKP